MREKVVKKYRKIAQKNEDENAQMLEELIKNVPEYMINENNIDAFPYIDLSKCVIATTGNDGVDPYPRKR